jgi:hypothetical protein
MIILVFADKTYADFPVQMEADVYGFALRGKMRMIAKKTLTSCVMIRH